MNKASCPSAKVRYVTSASAHAASQAVTKRGKQQRPYRCDQCHGWHLTHYLREYTSRTREGAINRPRVSHGQPLTPMKHLPSLFKTHLA